MENEERNSLLQQLHRLSNIHPLDDAPAEPATLPNTPAYDFGTHEKYSEIRLARAGAQMFEVASPFFRSATAVEGTRLKINDQWVENFASYDYLGLNQTKEVRGAAADAAMKWGVSATASRLVGGEREIHATLEKELAEFVGADSALTFVSGHSTNIAVLRTLVGQNDLVLVDALAHNSIYEGIRASGAKHRSFPHNDWQWVDQFLQDERSKFDNVIIAIEGLYSMDGDTPDLAKFVDVKLRHGAWLLVDEAHSLGVVGATGRGIAEKSSVERAHIDITMGTLSKTFASCGGFIAGSEKLIDLLQYMAPNFVYSVGLSLPNTAAALAAVRMISTDPDRVTKLRKLSLQFKAHAEELGYDCGMSEGYAVTPVIIGDSIKATKLSNRLLDAGHNVLPIIAPAVPERTARLRFFINCDHTLASCKSVLAEIQSQS